MARTAARGSRRRGPIFPLAISGGYAVIAGLYIFTSDQLLARVVHDTETLTQLQMIKGLLFILITAILLYWLASRHRARIRHSEAGRAEIETRYQQMIETTNEGVWIVDDEGRTRLVNPTMATMLGYASDDMIGRRRVEFTDPEYAAVMEEQLARRRSGHRDVYECRLLRSDGSPRWVIIASTPLQDHDGGFLGSLKMVTDITERKAAEVALADACRAQQSLLNELNHRVRNNLSALLGLVELGRSRATSVGEFASSIGGRIGAMNRAYSMLAASNWNPPRLDALIEHVAEGEVRRHLRFDGSDVRVPPQQVGALALVMHELLADWVERSAGRLPDATVDISWAAASGDDHGAIVELDWVDGFGPAKEPRAAQERNIGLDLIKGLVRSDLRGEAQLNVSDEGARHHLRIVLLPLPQLVPPREPVAV